MRAAWGRRNRPPQDERLDLASWNVAGCRLSQAAAHLPARPGILRLQETTIDAGIEYWEGYGYVFAMHAQEQKIRATAIEVRKDIAKKMGFGIEYASTQLIVAYINSARSKLRIFNFYIPPAGSKHHNSEVVGRLSECDENSFMGGDFNWVGTESMQKILRAGQESDDAIKMGTKYITQRDEEIWSAWRGRRTLAPRRVDTSTWTTRTCGRTGTRSRCDNLIVPHWVNTTGYTNIGCRDTVRSEHEMIVTPRRGRRLRLRDVGEVEAQRRRRRWTSRRASPR